MTDILENVLEDKAPLDTLIQNLAKFTEDTKAQLPITLYVNGTIVSGMLIGPSTFAEQFEGMIRSMTANKPEGNDLVRSLADAIKRGHELNVEEMKEVTRMEREAALLNARYIYLREAEITNPNGPNIPAGVGGLIRIRLASVDMFSMGMLRGVPPAKRPTSTPEIV